VASEANLFETAYQELFSWCAARDFAGHDPFDALNSRVLRSTPLSKSKNARFVWTQLVKRSPVDLRPWALVPPQRNPKGIALFALGLLANFRRQQDEASPRRAADREPPDDSQPSAGLRPSCYPSFRAR